MKVNKFLSVISILTIVVMLIGATFAYFSVSTASNEGAIAAEAAYFDIKLAVEPLYTGKSLIPTNDSDIDIAFNNECVDKYNNGACSAYTITVKNDGQEGDYIGNIEFNLVGITNLMYRLLDENGNVYVNDTLIESDTIQSLGNQFMMTNGDEKTFTLVIWLSNKQYIQDDDDANGSFSASVTYTSSVGSLVTASFSV